MVNLNLDENDVNLMAYAGFISKMARSEEIHFVYVANSLDVPEEVKKIYPELAAPVQEAAEARVRELVETHFNGYEESRLVYKSLEGPPLGRLIACTKEFDIDLLIVSHHENGSGANGYLSEKLARKAFCSVFMIPWHARLNLEKILVAVDFSEHSINALDVGSAFAKGAGADSIYILNNYRIPKGYYKTGKSYEEFADVMHENSRTRFNALLPRVDLKNVGIKPYFHRTNNIVQGIQSFAETIDSGLIVVGARGRSGDISAILLGSITEGLIRNLSRPLLAVKNKGEGLNILEALSSS
jgi:nucleotide-binding universal stress UspA family protein